MATDDHAEKTLAATHLAFFELTDEAGRLPAALEPMREAAAAPRSTAVRMLAST